MTLGKSSFGSWQVQKANSGAGLEGWPRVGMLHSFYRSNAPSGENLAVQSHFEILAAHGVDVTLVGVYSDSAINSVFRTFRTGVSVSQGAGLFPPPEIDLESVDIMHIHNTFPNISHRWLSEFSVPMVATIHNYRAFCATGTFTRQGNRCFECVEKSPWKSLAHACYRNSRIATLPITLQQTGTHSWAHFLNSLKLTLVPGDPMCARLKDLGLHNSVTLPHPVDVVQAHQPPPAELQNHWLFVGRLDRDKGILDLLKIWPESTKLIVIGSGPSEIECVNEINSRSLNVDLLGTQERQTIANLMAYAQGLVFPSKALEGAPLVYGEALSVGLPVLAADGNVLADQVRLDGTGTSFSLADQKSLLSGIDAICVRRDDLSKQCLETYETRYTISHWLRGLLAAYKYCLG